MNKNLLYACFIFLICGMHAQQRLDPDKKYQVAAIGFWNVENLFDTLNDPDKNDDEFTPDGTFGWNGERYRQKIRHLSETIALMATETTPDGLALIGLCEVENSAVLHDLVNAPALKRRNYQYILIEGPDIRGIDPALIYNPVYFKVEKALAYRVPLETDPAYKTRDILVVSGKFGGEQLCVLVNHWPSRRGGEAASRPNRHSAARIARKIADSVALNDPAAKIIIMGDLNDDPVNASLKKGIRTSGNFVSNDLYFNPFEKLYKKGIGTLAWGDSWNLFDQVLLNASWRPGTFGEWQYLHARVYNKTFLRSEYGNFRGYPFRTFSGGAYTGGYSDHFPVYIAIARQEK